MLLGSAVFATSLSISSVATLNPSPAVFSFTSSAPGAVVQSAGTTVSGGSLTQVGVTTYCVPVLDGSVSAGTGGGSSLTVSLTTTNANDIIYVIVVINAGSTNAPTATGLTFLRRGASDISVPGAVMGVYYAVASSAGTYSITESASRQKDTVVVAFGVSGAKTASPFDPNASIPKSATGPGTTASVTISTSNPDDFIIGAVADNGRSDPSGGTAVAPFILIATQNDGVDRKVDGSAEYYQVTTTQKNLVVAFNTDPTAKNWAIMADAIVNAPHTISVSVLDSNGNTIGSGTASITTCGLTNVSISPSPSMASVRKIVVSIA
jgi:hypothetical protein